MKPILIDEIPTEIQNFLGTINSVQYPRQGHTSDVCILKSEDRHAVLKRTKGKQFCEWLRKEVEVLEILAQTDLFVPKVYMLKDEGEEVWALLELLEGETLRSYFAREENLKNKYSVISQFGQALANLHATPCPKPLQKGDWLDEMLRQAQYNLENYQVEGTMKQLQFLMENKPKQIEQSLIHGDFTIDNVLVKDGVIAGIIDWSGGAFGDPRYDLALAIRPKPSIFEDEKEIAIFFDGYGKKMINDAEYTYFEEGLYAFF
ncbi:aminoglycoside phosphotransferase family protein [Anaerobacillus alkaliphilus]|uniref:Aminoglycoside phosphotransferase family protein n=1 Tax=Anaerobacillus alkaliphilus TaxID=1548597 RepID=A0A4Q0VY15_9BACI|nr:aminoglycoside phosphotransferase family protein [Anaerobacillus alkaliphilus]RXJ04637.1 aminoglycoside phosphotransferase family protein [Anaerobacillus alkaliphilus]